MDTVRKLSPAVPLFLGAVSCSHYCQLGEGAIYPDVLPQGLRPQRRREVYGDQRRIGVETYTI